MTRRVTRAGDGEGVTELMKAAAEWDTDKIRELVAAGEDLNARDKNGRNILYHAFSSSEMTQGVLEVFRALGEVGVDFNSSLDTDGCTALITAITLGWPILVQLLIDHGVDIHDEGMPKFGASVSSDQAFRASAGGDDAQQQDDDHDRFIFSKGCSQHVSPLLCATLLKRYAIVDILLAADADCQQTSCASFWKSSNVGACSVCDVRVNPVHIAAYNGDVDLLRRFLAICQARCLQENRNGRKPIKFYTTHEEDITPLWLALLKGEMGAVKALLEYDFPRAPPCHFGSGLFRCLAEDRYDIARLLLQAGYDLWEDLEWIESETYPTANKDIIDFIQDFVSHPPSLMICSRNALRRHMGPRLSTYLSMVTIPQKVADVIMLKDVLSMDAPASEDDIAVTLELGTDP